MLVMHFCHGRPPINGLPPSAPSGRHIYRLSVLEAEVETNFVLQMADTVNSYSVPRGSFRVNRGSLNAHKEETL